MGVPRPGASATPGSGGSSRPPAQPLDGAIEVGSVEDAHAPSAVPDAQSVADSSDSAASDGAATLEAGVADLIYTGWNMRDIVADDHALYLSKTNHIIAIDRDGNELRDWTIPGLNPPMQLVLGGDYLYWMLPEGFFRLMRTGTTYERLADGDYFDDGIVAIGNDVFAMYRPAHIPTVIQLHGDTGAITTFGAYPEFGLYPGLITVTATTVYVADSSTLYAVDRATGTMTNVGQWCGGPQFRKCLMGNTLLSVDTHGVCFKQLDSDSWGAVHARPDPYTGYTMVCDGQRIWTAGQHVRTDHDEYFGDVYAYDYPAGAAPQFVAPAVGTNVIAITKLGNELFWIADNTVRRHILP